MNYITNAFSLNMLSAAADVRFTRMDVGQVREHLDMFDYMSAIGHADTAAVVSAVLGREVKFNRMSVELDTSDWGKAHSLIIAQYKGPRLPEGATSLPDGAEIEFWYACVEHPR